MTKEEIENELHRMLADIVSSGYPKWKRGRYREAIKEALEQLQQEPCDDCISRFSIKKKLQEHHDFYVNAYGGFNNLPPNDKPRVDEITNCISMVVNEPPVTPQPKIGQWFIDERPESDREVVCSNCGQPIFKYHKLDFDYRPKYCPNCGAKMQEVEG